MEGVEGAQRDLLRREQQAGRASLYGRRGLDEPAGRDESLAWPYRRLASAAVSVRSRARRASADANSVSARSDNTTSPTAESSALSASLSASSTNSFTKALVSR